MTFLKFFKLFCLKKLHWRSNYFCLGWMLYVL